MHRPKGYMYIEFGEGQTNNKGASFRENFFHKNHYFGL